MSVGSELGHIQVVLSLDNTIGKKQVGGWKHAPVSERSKPGKHSAVVFTAEAAPSALATAEAAEAAEAAESVVLEDGSDAGASASAAAAAASATRRSNPSWQMLGMTMENGRRVRRSS